MIPISEVNRLLSLGVGDAERLRHILESVERHRPLYQSDIRYVTNLSLTYPEQEPTAPETHVVQDTAPDVFQDASSIPDKPASDQFIHPYSMPAESGAQEAPVATPHRGVAMYKSEGVALCLSLTVGLLGFFGLGHRYVGDIWRGLGLLYLGWALLALNLLGTAPIAVSTALEMAGIQQGGYWPPLLDLLGYAPGSYTASAVTLIVIAPIAFLVTLVWQAHGAQKLCKRYNIHMEMTGMRLYAPTKRQMAAFAVVAAIPAIGLAAIALAGLTFFT